MRISIQQLREAIFAQHPAHAAAEDVAERREEDVAGQRDEDVPERRRKNSSTTRFLWSLDRRRTGTRLSLEKTRKKIKRKTVPQEHLQEDVDYRREPVAGRRRNAREERLQNILDEAELVRAAIRRYDEVIRQLEREPTCPPRNFEEGEIYREEEKFMRCAFCEATGMHYSDSCVVIRLARERRQVLMEKRRCQLCLEKHCSGDRYSCPKYYASCHHCRFPGHHSAVCELPDAARIYGKGLRKRAITVGNVLKS
ncbi:hypothetical protein OSTOST_00887 [Ostertagia ostertagi]